LAARYTVWRLAEGRAPTVSADGRLVWFWSRTGAQWQLHRSETDGANMVALTGPGTGWPDVPGQTSANVRAVSVCASGSTLVAVARYVLHPGSSPVDLSGSLTEPNGELLDALVTRDGSRVVALAKGIGAPLGPDARLMVGSPAGAPWVTVWEGPLGAADAKEPRLAASADGTVLALVIGDSSDGGEAPGVGRVSVWALQEDGTWASDATDPQPARGLPCLSADGQRLAYVDGLDGTRVLTFDRARRAASSIATGATGPITSLAMDDFGRRIAACAAGRVYYAAFTGHTSHEVPGLSGARSVSLSADGDVLAAETSRGIMVGLARGGGAVPAVPSARPVPAGPSAAATARGRQIRTFDETLADLYRLAQRIRLGPAAAPDEAEAEAAPRPSETGIIAAEANSGWQLYEHAGLSLRVLVPPGWQVLEDSSEDGIVLMGAAADTAPGDGAAPGPVGIRLTLAPPDEDDLMLVAQEAMSVAELDAPPTRSSCLLSGATAVRLDANGTVDGVSQRLTTIAATIGGRTYCAAALTPSSAGTQTRAWVRRSLQSLTVTP